MSLCESPENLCARGDALEVQFSQYLANLICDYSPVTWLTACLPHTLSKRHWDFLKIVCRF